MHGLPDQRKHEPGTARITKDRLLQQMNNESWPKVETKYVLQPTQCCPKYPATVSNASSHPRVIGGGMLVS